MRQRRSKDGSMSRVFSHQQQNYQMIGLLWKKQFPHAKRRPLTILEKCVHSVILSLEALSLCQTLKWAIFPGSRNRIERRNAVDLYAVVATAMLGVILWFCTTNFAVSKTLYVTNLYLVVEMLASTLRVQVVDWVAFDEISASPNRSIFLLLIGYMEVMFGFAILYLAHGALKGPDAISPFRSLYFSCITITTVGYGDFEPQNDIGRGLAMAEILTGLLMVAFMLARFLSLPTRPSEHGNNKRIESGRNLP